MYHSVIQALIACAAECNHGAAACLNKENVKMVKRCIMLEMDWAAICKVTAAALARGSEMAGTYLQAGAPFAMPAAKDAENTSTTNKACAEGCRSAA